MFKKLLGETAIYGLSSILGRTLNYLLVPLHTAVFMPGEFGVFTELYAYMAFLNVIFTYGMETTFFRFATKNKEKQNQFFNLSLTAIFGTTIVMGSILYFLAPSIAKELGHSDHLHILKWLVLILCFDTVMALPFAKLRLEGKAIQFAGIKILNILMNIGLNVFFLLFCPWSMEGEGRFLSEWVGQFYNPEAGVAYVFLANLMANGTSLLFFLPTWVSMRISWDGREIRRILAYAIPLLVVGLAGVTNDMLSRAMFKYVLPEELYEGQTNAEILGVFGATYKLSIFMTLAVQAFKYAYEPFFFKRAYESNSKHIYSAVMNGFIYFTCGAWLLITIVLPDLATLFLRHQDYRSAIQIVPILLGAGVFLGVFYNLSVWYKLTEKNWYGATISVCGAFLTVILNILLIPKFGYFGSAWASFFTYFAMAVVSFLWGKRHYPIPYQLGKISVYLSVAIAFVMVFNFSFLDAPYRYLIGGGMLTIFIVIIVAIEKPKQFSIFGK